ncbi:hypothetical protein OS493_025683 [Desmophyllum pertusum]|uniref:Uncharacterized protein n=1 Tax=Desmophyllum pertusum TaxID=174260 RepID=A0A9W9ZLP2_9CNID|nr:hypothetical protein OS493_025683 [Desmophyllum pertusum]
MVPAEGLFVAKPAGSIEDKAISTASEQPRVFHVVKGPEVRQPGLPLAPQVMVSSTLTPQMNSLHISSATSQQSQKPVIVEKSIGRRDQDAQTSENTETSQQAPTIITLGQSKRCYPVEYKTATELQEVGRFKTADQSRQSLDEKISSSHIMEKGACAYNTAMDRQHQRPAVSLTSDHESLLSDPSDSGIEITDNSGEGISQSKEKSYLDDVEMQRLKLKQKAAKLIEAEWNSANLSLLSGVASEITPAETKTKSIVDEICPTRSSVTGGIKFFLILNERLPSDVVSAHAYFGNSAPVPLTKINDVNLTGQVPACPVPGIVTVKVKSSTGNYLGETLFEYVDEIQAILRQLVHDEELQGMFFHLWAQGLGNKTDESEKRRPSQPSSSFKTYATEKPGMTKNVYQHFDNDWDQGLGNKESGSDSLQPAEHSVVRTLACQEPGIVTGKVRSSTGNYLGETSFEYVDEVPDILQQLEHDKALHETFFHLWSQGLGNKTDEREKQQPSQPAPSFKTEGNQDNESDYDADDEASSCDSSDDGSVSCNEVASGYPNSKILSYDKGDISDNELCGGQEIFVFYDLDNLPFYGQESEATISQLDLSGFPVKREEQVSDKDAYDNFGSTRGNEEASGNGVYYFIRDLIAEGKDACRFVNKEGRYVVNWSRALTSYADYKSKKNPQFKNKNISRRKQAMVLRAALLNFYKKDGAKEYKDCKKVNDKDEVIERQFQMPPQDDSEHETSSIASEADEKPQVPVTPNSSDTGFDEAMDICDDLFNTKCRSKQPLCSW